ncbi:HAD domain-containing protein [Noviherbaspirillum galbum]|uniref:Uncharacterized protein n=1 Tax=Noviherbaspirillum galbum TaxID=2709383 RepID=A0A6B3STA6_9BURK|nr:HAD domain-containing protein [Noviherbaspirillum galbum]NEX63997.1 hypothetical protein [Noviherbaspirillum galbum]
MRVIFLDVDGVLHPASAAIRFSLAGSPRANAQALWLFRWAWILDELLAPYPDVGIIVHSDWRLFLSSGELQSLLGPLGRRFIGVTPRGPRPESVAAVLETADVEDHLVLEAGIDNAVQSSCQVRCDPMAGLQDFRVQARIRAWLATGDARLAQASGAGEAPQRGALPF